MDADTAMGGPRGRFPSTQLTLLNATALDLNDDAMNRIIALYWKPVYCFLRVKLQKSNEDAKDLTQGFFASILQRSFFSRFDPSKASFRTYLRMAAERYAANQYAAANCQKRGGHVEFQRLDENISGSDSPDVEFEREWRRQVFYLALDDLRSYCEEQEKQLHFRIFRDYDLADDTRPSYATLSARYAIPETSVTNHLAWARRTLRHFVIERLRGTTANVRELHREMRRIWK